MYDDLQEKLKNMQNKTLERLAMLILIRLVGKKIH